MRWQWYWVPVKLSLMNHSAAKEQKTGRSNCRVFASSFCSAKSRTFFQQCVPKSRSCLCHDPARSGATKSGSGWPTSDLLPSSLNARQKVFIEVNNIRAKENIETLDAHSVLPKITRKLTWFNGHRALHVLKGHRFDSYSARMDK